MSIFPHFKADQLWLVVVQKADKLQYMETWLAPAGQDGTRRIFRNMKSGRVPLAALSLTDLLKLQRSKAGLSQTILSKTLGPQQAVFVSGNSDGSSSIIQQRSKHSMDAARKSGYGSAAVAAMPMVQVCEYTWHMRKLLDSQDVEAVSVNLLNGNGLPPNIRDTEIEQPKRPALWAKQDPGENDD